VRQAPQGLGAQGFVCDRPGERRRAQAACTIASVRGEGLVLGEPAMLCGRRGLQTPRGWQQLAASRWRTVTAPPAALAGGAQRRCESKGGGTGGNMLRMAGPLRADTQAASAAARAGGMERFYESEGYEAGSNVLRMVGYFALVGLLRVHTLVGDYGGALAALAPIHPFQRAHLFTPKLAGARPASPRTRARTRWSQGCRRALAASPVPARAPARAQGRRRAAGLAAVGAGRRRGLATRGVARAALCRAASRMPAGFRLGSRVAP